MKKKEVPLILGGWILGHWFCLFIVSLITLKVSNLPFDFSSVLTYLKIR